MKIVRVTKTEFELDNGDIYPVVPPLEHEMSPEEFQEHYERACNIIASIKASRCNHENTKTVGEHKKADNS